MSIKEQLTADMREAMKSGDRSRLSVLRYVLGEIQTQEKAGKSAVEFSDEQVRSVLTKQVKQRRDSADIYTKAGQPDRATVETQEADILETYLPSQMAEQEVADLVDVVIAEQGASTMRDMGKVVKAVLARADGRTDGKTVSGLVKVRLAG